jgi:tripartite ATP-independent transporter DctM subunit
MNELFLTLTFLAILFFFLGTGIWVAMSLLGVAVIGMLLFTSRPVGDAMATTIWGASSSWSLTALPLFIWMGEILFRTKLSENLFRGLTPWMQRLPGGLLHVNIVGSAIFAAISGSSAATVATVGKVSIPELRSRKYPERMIVGTLAGAGTLGLLIPPSITLIIYGVTVNESIAKLFIAGILPGIVLALMFMTYVVLWALFRREKGEGEMGHYNWAQKVRALGQLLPIIILILSVMGSIYLGLATATEAAVLGVIGGLILSAAQKSLTWDSFIQSLLGATRTSAMIAFILAGSSFLSLAMGFTGLPRALAEWISTMHLTPIALVAALTVFYIILGCCADDGGDRTDGSRRRLRHDLVRHLPDGRHRDGANHAADRLQPVRASGHDRARHGLYRPRRGAAVPDHGPRRGGARRVPRHRHLSAQHHVGPALRQPVTPLPP